MEAELLLGYPGTAEPAVPLNEEEPIAKAPPPQLEDHIGETSKTPLNDHESEVIAEFGEPASVEGLSLFMKLGLAGIILAACYAWVRAHNPRSSRASAGRHGAYEKGGLA